MARHLAAAGHRVVAYDPAVPADAVPTDLATAGIRVTDDPRRLGRAEVSLSMLPDAAATEALLFGEHGLLGGCSASHVHVVMGTVGPTCDASVLREDHIARETSRLVAARTVALSPNPWGRASASTLDFIGQRQENRTPEQYERQITDWEAACRTSWTSVTDTVAATFGPTVSISITNRQESFWRTSTPGPPGGASQRARAGRSDDFDPARCCHAHPAPGDLGRTPPTCSSPVFHGVLLRPFPGFDPGSPQLPQWGIGDHRRAVGDLRPRETYTADDDEMVLVVDDAALTELIGTWKITVRGHNAVYEGTLHVPVVTRDVTDVMQRLVVPDADGDESEPEECQ